MLHVFVAVFVKKKQFSTMKRLVSGVVRAFSGARPPEEPTEATQTPRISTEDAFPATPVAQENAGSTHSVVEEPPVEPQPVAPNPGATNKAHDLNPMLAPSTKTR